MIRTLDEHLEYNFEQKVKQIPEILKEYKHDGFLMVLKNQNYMQQTKDILINNMNIDEAIYQLLTNKDIALLNKSRNKVLSYRANDDILVECYIIKKLVEFVHTNHKNLSGIETTICDSYFDENVERLVELFNKGNFQKYEMIQIFLKQQFQNEATSSIPYNRNAVNKKIESIYLEKYKNAYNDNQELDKKDQKNKKKRKLRSLF